jgi:hypothetical protein
VPKQDAAPVRAQFPKRDAEGRVGTFGEMVAGVAVNLLIALVLLVAVDALGALVSGGFGHISGWLAGILVVWLFGEDFRAWGRGRHSVRKARWLAVVVGLLVGGLAGAALSGRLTALPNIVNGAISVLLACLLYAAIWFYGVRVLADRQER